MTPKTEKLTSDAMIAAAYAVLRLVTTCADVIKEFGRVPETVIFLAVQSKGVGLTGYTRIRDALVDSKMVRVERNEFVWVGDDPAPAKPK